MSHTVEFLVIRTHSRQEAALQFFQDFHNYIEDNEQGQYASIQLLNGRARTRYSSAGNGGDLKVQ